MSTVKLETKQAVLYLLINNMVKSKYALAKQLGVNAIMINNYLNKGTRMGVSTADKMKEVYNIEITNVYDNRSKIDDNTLDAPTGDS